ncbi:uncharacterized protein LOC110907026 [Helianthus annuus]|uniref:uncharacterized protein LOC110907026 n=1 Tax=Helianthus annuus TaxID=4232 RepID=UPI000B8F1BAA|nr:uncharacterized protein LOC110907026 [Helianthus annuus]
MGTYLLILKHMRKSESMNLAKFIQKIEEHELDIQKTAIMTNPNAQQDISLYYRGNKFETTPSPKIKIAFSADGSSGSNVSTTTQSGANSALIAQILEAEPIKSQPKRIPIFQELGSDADTDDEEEYINKARKGLDTDSFNLFFADKVEMLNGKKAARLKRELEGKRIAKEKEKLEAEKAEVVESSTKKVEEEECEIKVEVDEETVFEKYVKESYDVLNRTIGGLKKTNLEVDAVMTMMSSTLMTKQKVINEYIEDYAKLKQDLELEKIESERIKRLEAFKEQKKEETDTVTHEEFYNAYATPIAPVTAAETLYSENETGTYQKPPKLMYIEDFRGWQNRFETWVQAYKFDAWCSLEVDYEKPKNERGLEKEFSDYSDGEKLKYTTFEGESTKTTIDRYCHLVLEMGRLEITKRDDGWVDKLADALPQHKWGTYLLILKHMRKSESMNLAKFIQKIEEHELDIQKTAIMTNPNAQQDISLYYRGSKFETTPSPKIKIAFSADGSSGSNVSTTTQSGANSALIAQILEAEPIKSQPKRIPIFQELGSDADTDDEEEYINKARKGLDTDSFNLFFADKVEMLNGKKAARLKRELEGKRIAKEKEKLEAEKAEVVESSTKKVEEEECEIKVEVDEETVFEKYVKESYDVLSRTIGGLKKTNLEVDAAMTMMSSTLMTKQKVINEYIEDYAKLKLDLELEKIESERIKRLEAFKEQKKEETDTGKKPSVKNKL